MHVPSDRGVGVGPRLDEHSPGRLHIGDGLAELRAVGGGELLEIGKAIGSAIWPGLRLGINRQLRQRRVELLDHGLLGFRVLGPRDGGRFRTRNGIRDFQPLQPLFDGLKSLIHVHVRLEWLAIRLQHGDLLEWTASRTCCGTVLCFGTVSRPCHIWRLFHQGTRLPIDDRSLRFLVGRFGNTSHTGRVRTCLGRWRGGGSLRPIGPLQVVRLGRQVTDDPVGLFPYLVKASAEE